MNISIKMGTVMVAFFFLAGASCHVLTQSEIEDRINSSPRLPQMNTLCNSLPRPQEFEFVKKELSGNGGKAIVIYQFKTNLSYSDIARFYYPWFDQAGWVREVDWGENQGTHHGQFEYRKGNTTVWLEHVDFDNANYTISCSLEF